MTEQTSGPSFHFRRWPTLQSMVVIQATTQASYIETGPEQFRAEQGMLFCAALTLAVSGVSGVACFNAWVAIHGGKRERIVDKSSPHAGALGQRFSCDLYSHGCEMQRETKATRLMRL